ncbi:phosphoribosyl-ATP diphosphatase [Parvularcula sp. ZS-1/3]|uniref:Phosphoribosyl-ATP pyrophosphatase n=1 Tax=Parvularcula mediterranea TaxID=2732508 RepID=A0A7Y3RNG0_9PROT|nr:phosphoribosyl-ATP diphosphatase [Parvularcula mediterranea]NNU17284.1 phosphoribosyl-ATP diphosphatase [Parvularcula mediterranea]
MVSKIGNALDGLTKRIEARRGDDPSTSYTAKLLSEGKARCAKKMGEEAVETALAGALGDKEELAAESADLLYHLAVLLEANGISFDEVAAELEKRAGTSGIAEKASRER